MVVCMVNAKVTLQDFSPDPAVPDGLRSWPTISPKSSKFRAFSRCFCATMQDADQHIKSSLGFSLLPKDTSTCRPGELNQRPSDNKMLALPQRQVGAHY